MSLIRDHRRYLTDPSDYLAFLSGVTTTGTYIITSTLSTPCAITLNAQGNLGSICLQSNGNTVISVGAGGAYQTPTNQVAISPGAGPTALSAIATSVFFESSGSGGAEVFTLANGVEGQHCYCYFTVEGGALDTIDITPTSFVGTPTLVRLNGLGDSCHLMFINGSWTVVGAGPAVTLA